MREFEQACLALMLGAAAACGSEPSLPVTVSPLPTTVTVALGPPVLRGGATRKGHTLADRGADESVRLLHYPDASAESLLVNVHYGDALLELGLDEGPMGWSVSADLDADGVVGDGERVPMTAGADGRLSATLAGAVTRGEVTVPVPIEVRTQVTDGTRTVSTAANTVRQGRLPNGVAISVDSARGVFDHPDTEITVDEDGDGLPDEANFLTYYRLADGIVEAKGQRWSFALSARGDTLTLTPTDQPSAGLRKGRPAPDFSVVASDGVTHDLARYRGRRLLMDFWATWCAPCIALHPEVKALAERHKLAVIGIAANDTQGEVDRWLRKNPTPWPSAAVGPDGAVNLAYGVSSWPTHALIDEDGRLVVLGSFRAVVAALGDTLSEASASP